MDIESFPDRCLICFCRCRGFPKLSWTVSDLRNRFSLDVVAFTAELDRRVSHTGSP